MGPARQALRAATHAIHERLDKAAVLRPLTSPAITVAQYRAALVALHGFNAPIERALGADAARLDLLRADLADLGLDAESLPVASRSVDAYTIAFGLRNVTRIDAALAEARRVLKPGGRFFCLEFSRVVLPVLREAYDLYSFQVLPRLGRMIAKDEESYRYLVESIRRFPDQNALVKRIEAAGFASVRVRNLSGGIAAIHSGWRV